MEKQKICIIGGGLTGLITAAALSKLNLKIDLITENTNQNIKSNRTTAISQDNYDYIKKSGIFKFSEKDFWPCSEIKLYTENKNKKFNEIFKFNESKNKKVFYMVSNYKIMTNVIRKIKKEKLISLKLAKKISEIVSSGLLKSLKFEDTDHSKYNLVINCTGNNSNLSKNFFQDSVIKRSYGEISITTVIEHNFFKNNIAKQIFLDNEILALLPISNTKTSIVWSIKKESVNKYKYNEDKFFKKQIKFYTKNFLKNIKFNTNLEIRDLNLLIRKNYYKDRVLLFGDALHAIHPFVGQGFNMMIRDLSCLEKILEDKTNLGLDVGGLDVLSEFSYETKVRNFAYSMGVDFLKNSFSFKNQTYKRFRDKIITKLNKNNYAKDLLLSLGNEGFKF